MKKGIILVILFLTFFAAGGIYAKKTYTAKDIYYNDKTVEEVLNSLDNNLLLTNAIAIDYTYDANKATINYTAEEDITVLVVGIATSTHFNGDSNTSISTSGTYETLVNGEKTGVNGAGCYSKKYAYKVTLHTGDTLDYKLWSNQGNTSNEVLLFRF